MAWQHSAPMGPNGGGNNVGGDGHGSQSHTTEYTLQGVMRFLQVEWQRHERDRNAWDIERAEMRSRLAKLEGEAVRNEHEKESLGKHVKMLGNLLKAEREKVKALKEGGPPADKQAESSKEDNTKDRPKLPSKPNPHNSFMDVGNSEPALSALMQETERTKSGVYLQRCLEEVTYHVLTAPTLQNGTEEQEQGQPNEQYVNHQGAPSQQSEELYAQQVRAQQQQHQRYLQQTNHTTAAPPPSIPNHQPPPVPHASDASDLARTNHRLQRLERLEQAQHSQISRAYSDLNLQPPRRSMTAIDSRIPQQNHLQPTPEPEHAEDSSRVLHSFNTWGQEIPPQEEVETTRIIEEPEPPEIEGWNFDDPSEPARDEPPPPDYPLPQRPDTDIFPHAQNPPPRSTSRGGLGSHRKRGSLSKRRTSSETHETSSQPSSGVAKADPSAFKVKFALRGHLDVVRSVIFTGGGSPSEPEICTTGDDGVIKRWIIPAAYGGYGTTHPPGSTSSSTISDLDIPSCFTHRGHTSAVLSLAASPSSQSFSNGGRASGDGWVFSGGKDATVRVWERGRVDPKATLEGHSDAVWTLCVLPGTAFSVLGDDCARFGGPDRLLLASGAADGTILIWAVTAPPMMAQPAGQRGARGSRRANSVSAGSNFPTSPQPSTASQTSFASSLVHRIERAGEAAPTCICPLGTAGEAFVVSYNDANVLVYDASTGEEVVGMASLETYDGTLGTAVNAIAATSVGLDGTLSFDAGRGVAEGEDMVHGATGGSRGQEGVVLSGHEDRYIRFFDANSGQCTYNMLAHPSAISSLSLSPDGRELVSAGHDASLRFWSLEKRTCIQEITSHRLMRGEGVCAVVWSHDGRFVVGAGGDGVVKVFAR